MCLKQFETKSGVGRGAAVEVDHSLGALGNRAVCFSSTTSVPWKDQGDENQPFQWGRTKNRKGSWRSLSPAICRLLRYCQEHMIFSSECESLTNLLGPPHRG